MDVYYLEREINIFGKVAWQNNEKNVKRVHAAVLVDSTIYEFTTEVKNLPMILGSEVEGKVLIGQSKVSDFPTKQYKFKTHKTHEDIKKWLNSHSKEMYKLYTNNCQSFTLGLLSFLAPSFDSKSLLA